MATKAQCRASAKYDKENTRSILLKFNKTTDADILCRLDAEKNRQGYVKKLIRADIRGIGDVLTIDSIGLIIMPLVKKYEIERAYIFGSYARGEAKEESDVDLLIEGGKISSINDYMTLTDKLSQALGKNVDIATKESIERDKSRFGKRLRTHIERDKVLIYEAI